MKKIVALLLTLVMLLGAISFTAYADEDTRSASLTGIDNTTAVEAEYKTKGANPHEDTTWDESYTVVSVSVSWSTTNFKYDFGTEWDPSVHEYINQPGWDRNYIDVTVVNHSNCPVNASIYDVWASHEDTVISYLDNITSMNIESAIDADPNGDDKNTGSFRIIFDYNPDKFEVEYTELIGFGVKIGRFVPPEPVVTPDPDPDEDGDGEHVHHYVYDQFGRLVCTGCGDIKHEYCVDFDEDGLCDECGLERDFCPDCHVGGRCLCT